MNIAGFDILEEVGEGSKTSVWKARQVSLGRIVAIKMIAPRFTSNPDKLKGLIEEIGLAAKLKHPNLAHVYDVVELKGAYYLITEYIDGSTLSQILQDQGQIAQKKALKIARFVAEALEDAWNKSNMIHYAVKPDNIMVDEEGIVKLVDLGFARIMDSESLAEQIQAETIDGTPNYMSPEQANCTAHLDCRTDMYSLGATLYHMVTGRIPFADSPPLEVLAEQITGHLPNPRDINPSISVSTAQIIARLMMKNPHDRYDDWSEFLHQVKKAVSGVIVFQKDKAAVADSTIQASKAKVIKDVSVNRKQPARAVPLWIRLPAWALLWAWWIFFAYYVTKNPLDLNRCKGWFRDPTDLKKALSKVIPFLNTEANVPEQTAIEQ